MAHMEARSLVSALSGAAMMSQRELMWKRSLYRATGPWRTGVPIKPQLLFPEI